MKKLEEELEEMQKRCEEADHKYEEIQNKVNQTEAELEKDEMRAEVGEIKILEMEEELRVVATPPPPPPFRKCTVQKTASGCQATSRWTDIFHRAFLPECSPISQSLSWNHLKKRLQLLFHFGRFGSPWRSS